MNLSDLQRRLSAPFSTQLVRWHVTAQNADGRRVQLRPQITAPAVQDRLDAICPNGWTVALEVGANTGAVRARLTILETSRDGLGSEGTIPASAAAALVAAAEQFGIGRYLKDVRAEWCDYDATQDPPFQAPAMPEWARPDYEMTPGGAHIIQAIQQLRCTAPVDLDLQREVYKHLKAALAVLRDGVPS